MKDQLLQLVTVLVLAVMAYVFRDNTVLASIILLGLVGDVLLFPAFQKLRSLQRFAAEFTPQSLVVSAEAHELFTEVGADSVGDTIRAQIGEAQTELAAVVDSHIRDSWEGVPEELLGDVRESIDQYMITAQHHATAAVELLVGRAIFEFALRGPVREEELIRHLTYLIYGRSDHEALLWTNQWLPNFVQPMLNRGALRVTDLGGVRHYFVPKLGTQTDKGQSDLF